MVNEQDFEFFFKFDEAFFTNENFYYSKMRLIFPISSLTLLKQTKKNLLIYWRERAHSGEGEIEEERESQVDFMLSIELGLSLMTLKSLSEPKPKVRGLTHSPPRIS